MMKTKYHLSIFLIALFAGLMAFATDAAAKSYHIWVYGVQITSENAANITGPNITGKVSFDESTHTLTLNNATIDGDGYSAINYYSSGGKLIPHDGITIRLQGNNTLKSGINTALNADATIRITGGGSLTIKCGNIAIDAKDNLTIDGCTLTTDRRIEVWGNLQINNSNVHVNDINNGYTFKAKNSFTLSGCKITQPAGAKIKQVNGFDGSWYTVVTASEELCEKVSISTGSEPEPEQPAKFTLDPKELTSGPDQNGQKVILSCNKPYPTSMI